MQKYLGATGAVRLVLSDKRYMVAFVFVAIGFSLAYSLLLFNSSVNLALPKIVFGLNAYALVLSTFIGALLALSITMNAFAFMNGTASSRKLGAGAVIAAIIPGSLCCTSVIPAILAALGASTSTIIGTTGALQGPFATYEPEFIAASIGMLLLSIFLVSKSIQKCCAVRKR